MLSNSLLASTNHRRNSVFAFHNSVEVQTNGEISPPDLFFDQTIHHEMKHRAGHVGNPGNRLLVRAVGDIYRNREFGAKIPTGINGHWPR